MAAQTNSSGAPNSSRQITRLAQLPFGAKPKLTPDMPKDVQTIIASVPGWGKSTFASTADDNFFLDFERRLEFIQGRRLSPLYFPKDEDGNEIDMSGQPEPFNKVLSDPSLEKQRFNWLLWWLESVRASIAFGAEEMGIKTVTLDTLDTLAELALTCFIADYGMKNDPRQTYQAMYKRLLPVMQRYTGQMNNVHRLYLCHLSEFMANGETKWSLSLSPFLSEWFTAHATLIGVLAPGKDAVTQQGINQLWFRRPNAPTKEGTGMLPDVMPAHMGALYSFWRGGDPNAFGPAVKGKIVLNT